MIRAIVEKQLSAGVKCFRRTLEVRDIRISSCVTAIRWKKHQQERKFSGNSLPRPSPPCLQSALKPGTPIPGLDIYKDKDPPIVLEKSEYPEWLATLAKPNMGLKTLAQLRRMSAEEATDKEKKRYLKLMRRAKIRKGNEEAKAG